MGVEMDHPERTVAAVVAAIEEGLVFHRAGRLAEADAAYQRALVDQPDHPDALHLRGMIAHESGTHRLAVELVDRAIAARGDVPDFHNSLGRALQAQGYLDEAANAYRRALELKPDFPDAHNNLGAVCTEQGKLEMAVACCQRATSLKLNYAEAHNNLGVAFYTQGKVEAAIACHQKAIALKPTYTEAHNNLGVDLKARGKPEAAIAAFREAIVLTPSHFKAHYNLGIAFAARGKLEAAIASYQTAIALKPNYADACYNLGMCFLQSGKLDQGWEHHEWRWQVKDRTSEPRRISRPLWDGSPLKGRTILIWGEQGIGDEIMFANVVSDVIACASRCVIECDGRLVPVLARSFPQAEVYARPLQAKEIERLGIDVQLPIGSLPRFFRRSIDAFPTRAGYLVADSARTQYWRDRLAAVRPGLTVGVSWRSMNMTGQRTLAFAGLDQWDPVFAVPGVHFVNLQYDDCADEIAEVERRCGVTIHRCDGIDFMNELDDAAALISAVDLVVSGLNSVAFVAGALGRAVWVPVLPRNEVWMMLGTAGCPWCPSMRMFPRGDEADWRTPMIEISSELTALTARRRDGDHQLEGA